MTQEVWKKKCGVSSISTDSPSTLESNIIELSAMQTSAPANHFESDNIEDEFIPGFLAGCILMGLMTFCRCGKKVNKILCITFKFSQLRKIFFNFDLYITLIIF